MEIGAKKVISKSFGTWANAQESVRNVIPFLLGMGVTSTFQITHPCGILATINTSVVVQRKALIGRRKYSLDIERLQKMP